MTKAWFKDTLERLLWTAVQGALTVLTLDQFGWIQLVDGELWKAAAGGAVAGTFSFLKSVAASRLADSGGTAQLGTKTYSYTEPGPGSAGGDL